MKGERGKRGGKEGTHPNAARWHQLLKPACGLEGRVSWSCGGGGGGAGWRWACKSAVVPWVVCRVHI
jgi:hypothetical protein